MILATHPGSLQTAGNYFEAAAEYEKSIDLLLCLTCHFQRAIGFGTIDACNSVKCEGSRPACYGVVDMALECD